MPAVTADPQAGLRLGGCGPAAEWSEPVAASWLQKVPEQGRLSGLSELRLSKVSRKQASCSYIHMCARCTPLTSVSHALQPSARPPQSPSLPCSTSRVLLPGFPLHSRRTTLTISCLRR